MSEAKFDYALVDSGERGKLERFGSRLLMRPSSLCIWKRRAEPAVWDGADAVHEPTAGWKFRQEKFEGWVMQVGNVRAWVRLQNNGRVGIFPEHQSYASQLQADLLRIQALKNSPPSVLNLFAFSGVFTCAAAQRGAKVCHVDISKRALDWTRENLDLNSIAPDLVRLIPEDAVKFIEREQRRGSVYDLVIADPPSFSRVTSSKEWQLGGILGEFLRNTLAVLDPSHGVAFITSHYSELGAQVFVNLLSDLLPRNFMLQSTNLTLQEQDSNRALPAGFLVQARASH